ncbi:MAG: M12 family metallopeptidase [Bacteroidales bacterium]|nr:M12 family metallopeptidase [Bacteroidales bacterium]
MKNRSLFNNILSIYLIGCFALFSSCNKVVEDEHCPKLNEQSNEVCQILEAFPNEASKQVTLSNGVVIDYYRDSIPVIDGDIILTPKQVEYLKENSVSTKSAIITRPGDFWHNGVVYYNIADDFVNPSDVYSAMNAISQRVPTITFTRATNGDYIEFISSDANAAYSSIGSVGGRQYINLGANIQNRAISGVHEIMHALGIAHEHTRADRDNYITVNFQNIKQEKQHNFQKYTEQNYYGFDYGEFDFYSIMLYGSYNNFAIDESVPTMTTKSGNAFWRNYSLSLGDIKALQVIYGNANTPFYIKLVEDITIIRDVVDQNYDYYEYEATNKLLFFKDAKCTQPYTLENDRLIQIGFYNYNSQSDYNYSRYNIMLTAGMSEYQLVDTYLIDENWQGNSIQYKGTSYFLYKVQW